MAVKIDKKGKEKMSQTTCVIICGKGVANYSGMIEEWLEKEGHDRGLTNLVATSRYLSAIGQIEIAGDGVPTTDVLICAYNHFTILDFINFLKGLCWDSSIDLFYKEEWEDRFTQVEIY